MEIVLALLAGALTLLNPCVLPLVPVVLASALQSGRFGPAALLAGMSVTFVALGVGINAFGYGLGLDAERLAQAGAVVMILFGLVLLLPRAGALFARATSGMAARADAQAAGAGRGLGGQALAGALLGVVWSPCVGPTLGGAIALAAQGEGLGRAAAIMAAYALGLSAAMLVLAALARRVVLGRSAVLRRLSALARPVMGAVFVAVGALVLTGAMARIEGWLLDAMPAWLVDLTVAV
ncbi:MAG: cytochrome c biogenesis protein CcdA [Alphaproteobacteria bacterium]|nr:MAG: cytochrome c biogenesis protein CcdA [Alphaproteobacteria bacterium]